MIPRLRISSFAIVGFLVSYALTAQEPQRQMESRDDQIRAQISEGLNLSAGIKAALHKFYEEHGRFPEDSKEAGLAEGIQILGRYVISVSIGASDGVVVIEYGNYADPIISGSTLEFSPIFKDSELVWVCSSRYIPAEYLPVQCES